MKNKKLGLPSIIPAFAVSALALFVSSDLTHGQTSTEANSSYTISTTHDLLLGASAIASSGDFTAGSSTAGLSVLTDGSFGDSTGGYDASTYSAGGGTGAGTYAIYSLGSDTLGYDLSDIEVYSGWNDGGRYQQGYTISISDTANDTTPADFTSLFTEGPYPASTFGANGAETETDSLDVTGAKSLMITFNAVDNGWTGYRELVVDGSTVEGSPEPSTYALMLVSGVASPSCHRC